MADTDSFQTAEASALADAETTPPAGGGMPARPGRMRVTLRALRHRNFQLFFGGQIISLIGNERQLCTYAHILERRHGKRVERLFLYWTGEEKKATALMEFPYRPELVDQAGRYFDEVVQRIENEDFRVLSIPAKR